MVNQDHQVPLEKTEYLLLPEVVPFRNQVNEVPKVYQVRLARTVKTVDPDKRVREVHQVPKVNRVLVIKNAILKQLRQ